jgi:TldD protein
VQAVAERDGEMQTASNNLGVSGGMEDLFSSASPDELADASARQAVDLLSAPYPDGGKATVILHPGVVGLLAHEAIGHTVEADFVLSGSIAAGKIGRKVASPLVTMVDSGHTEYGRAPAGALPVDDEGVAAGRTEIIKDGTLVSYLHNRETAAHFGVAPTGNARAFEFNDEPLIRMRNTFIEPGVTPLAEMIAGVKHGYLLEGTAGGQADANAEFVFGVQRAYEITDGKLGRLHRGVTISGQAFDVLNSVDAVGSDFEWGIGAGYCGKKQRCKVDAGGPHLRCTVTLGGAQPEIKSSTAMG